MVERRFSKEGVTKERQLVILCGRSPESIFSFCHLRNNQSGTRKQILQQKVALRSNFHLAATAIGNAHACQTWW